LTIVSNVKALSLMMKRSGLWGRRPLPFRLSFLCGPAPSPKPRALHVGWRYAFGLSLVAVLVWVAIEGLHFTPSPALAVPKGLIREVEESDESRVFAVLEAKIGVEPARSVIFKPQQPGMTIVWFEKILN
jgi:hypothetical protein